MPASLRFIHIASARSIHIGGIRNRNTNVYRNDDFAPVIATVEARSATSDSPIAGVGPAPPDELAFRHLSPHQTDD